MSGVDVGLTWWVSRVEIGSFVFLSAAMLSGVSVGESETRELGFSSSLLA